MSKVVSIRIPDDQASRLHRVARRMGRTPSETGALLVDEGLRSAEFGQIEFRNSPVGRQAYIRGSSLAVWEVVMIAKSYDLDAAKTAEHLGWPLYRVRAALNYFHAFPKEIEESIADNAAFDFGALSRMLPQAERFNAAAAED